MVSLSCLCILSQGMLSMFYVCLLFHMCILSVIVACACMNVYPCMFDVATCVYVPQYSSIRGGTFDFWGGGGGVRKLYLKNPFIFSRFRNSFSFYQESYQG